MTTMHFTDGAVLSAVVSALGSASARRLVATQTADGWDLDVPSDLEATVAAIDTPTARLTHAITTRVETLRSICAAAIVGGVVSDAIGAPYTYPTDETAQRNLNGLVAMSQLSADGRTYRFAAADASGSWGYREHTAMQIQMVGVAVADHIEAAMVKFDGLRNAAEAALDLASVDAIVW